MEHWLDKIGSYKSSSMGTMYSPFLLLKVLQALRAVGMPAKLERILLTQVAHESDSGTSKKAQKYNNYSGIKCNNHGLSNGCVDKFATYATINNWASDYKRVLSLSPGRPIDAINAQDFLDRLDKNNYFIEPGIDRQKQRVAYATAMNVRFKQVDKVLANKERLDYAIKDGVDKNELPLPNVTTSKGEKQGDDAKKTFWDGIPWYGKLGIGFGVVVVGVSIIKN